MKEDVIFIRNNYDKFPEVFGIYGKATALFPHEVCPLGYMRRYQNGGVYWGMLFFKEILATTEEYASLKAELESKGHNLRILTKYEPNKILLGEELE